MRRVVATVALAGVLSEPAVPSSREQKGSRAVQWGGLPPVGSPLPGPGSNGLARTPPMGWMSWERFRCDTDCGARPGACIGEQLYREMATRLAEDGFLEAGYSTVSIDDCWESMQRDGAGRLAMNSSRFPSGPKALADFMHGKGVSFGIYSDMGTKTCGAFPGSKGFEATDAGTFAEWGVDYLKLDGCYNDVPGFASGYPTMGAALQKSGRDIVYSCSWPAYLGSNETSKPYEAMIAAGCNLWRNWDDIDNTASSLISIIDHWGNYSSALMSVSGPGHWNDPDMILAGDDHYGKPLSTDLAKLQMTVWAITASPLIMAADLRTIQPEHKAILLNREVIAVDQDRLGRAGGRISPYGQQETWARELHDGSLAVAFVNKAQSRGPGNFSVTLQELGLPGSVASVRDLWASEGFLSTGAIDAQVPSPGVALYRVAPSRAGIVTV